MMAPQTWQLGASPRSTIPLRRSLLSGEETEFEPAEDVIHDRLGEADVGIVAPAAWFEAGVRELIAEQAERDSVLESDGAGAGEAVHEAGDG